MTYAKNRLIMCTNHSCPILGMPCIPPKTFIFGSDGFLGRRMLNAYRLFRPDITGTSFKSLDTLFCFDLLHPDISSFALAESGYTDAVICAGVTGISNCERNKKYTRTINIHGILELVRQLSGAGIKTIWFSSDYVFDGSSAPYTEKSRVRPLNEYGLQKAAVEIALPQVSKENYLILRLSKIFSLCKGDGTLLDEMAQKLWMGEHIKAAYDQIFCPTLIDDVVKAVMLLQSNSTTGLVNICAQPPVSRFELARQMAKSLRCSEELVERISLEDLEEDFQRPGRTEMASERMTSEIPLKFTALKDCIEIMARKYRTSKTAI